MQKIYYIIRRLLQTIPVLVIITILVFFGLRLIPGDPAVTILGDKASPQAIEAMHVRLGLNKPVVLQYVYFLKQILSLDFGTSIVMHRPVIDLFMERASVTIVYTMFAILFSVVLCVPLGYIAGMRHNRLSGHIIASSCLALLSLPEFWVGIIFLIIFAQKLQWFPIGGWGETWLEHIHSVILPAFTGALGSIALLVRNIQSGIIQVLQKDYVDFAKSKGLSGHLIRIRYVLKNVMVSSITLMAMRIAYMLGGSVVIETVFALPGLGKLLVDGVIGRDYPVVQATVLFFAVMVLLITLITDVCYSLIDPRVDLQ